MAELLDLNLQWGELIIVILAGLLTGIVNTLAGSGSLITLPIFMFLFGLPADVANGTNRIGALASSGIGFLSYRRSKIGQDVKGSWSIIAVAVAGGIFGALSAANLDETTMNFVIGGLMVCMLFFLLIKPKRWLKETSASSEKNNRPWVLLCFAAIGFYGGFIQAGIGIFLTMALVLIAHYSLVASTGIKLLIVFFLNIPAIMIFFYHNQIHWGAGILIAICQSIGAIIAIRLANKIPNANKWIYRLLILLVIISMGKFFIEWFG